MSVVLNLKLLTPGSAPPDQRARSLSEGELRIGRDADNGWVLEDEARLISRHHCTITARAGLFTLIDTSNNGVFINEGDRPLGRGNSVILSEGDLLHLGELTVQVAVTTRNDEPDAFRSLLPPLGAANNLGIGAPEQQPPAMPPMAVPRSSMMAPVRRNAGNPVGGGFGDDFDAAMPQRRDMRPIGAPPSFESTWSAPRTPFGDLPVEARETPGTPADHLPVEEEALPPIHMSPARIPDDWDLELEGGKPSPLRQPAFAPQPAPSPVTDPASAAPIPAPSAPAADSTLLMSFIEALAVIEEAASPAGQPRVLAGPPQEVLARLSKEDPDWVGLLLVGLSAEVAARLARAAAPPDESDPLSLSLPERANRAARDPGETPQ